MPQAAQIGEIGDSVEIKISSKNQLTIPSAARKKYEFGDAALCTFTEEGILIQPIEPADNSDDLTITLLRNLIEEGYEGDELLEKYEEIRPKFLDITTRLQEPEKGVADGKKTIYSESHKKVPANYSHQRILSINKIQRAVTDVAAKYNVAKVYLFGSYARGEQHEDSDVDLVLELGSPLGFKRAALIEDMNTAMGVPVDVIFGKEQLYGPVRQQFEIDKVMLYEH